MTIIRSLSMRILLASFATLLLSVVAFVAVFVMISRPALDRLIRPFQAMQLEDAVAHFETGGVPALAAYLDRLDARSVGRHFLMDAVGRDLRDGSDQSHLLARAGSDAPRPVGGSQRAIVHRSDDGRYRLVVQFSPEFGITDLLPYFGLILVAVAFVCWWLAVSIASPLRDLAAAADGFGRGHLSVVTSHNTRGDEIGHLARSFEAMAERIHTLLTAERRLLQDISHELRSPLTRLTVGIELFRTATDQNVAATLLQKEVDRLTRLVESLLEVTRAEGDPAITPAQAVDLWAVLKETADTCEIEASARGCRLVLTRRGSATLSGQAELLRRAFENVIRNAVRYAPAGSDIEVGLDVGAHESVVSVRDFGRGVSPEDLPQLAIPFFRAEPAREQCTGGVGLGLAIARRAVIVHHGSFQAEDAQPGLRICMTFPVPQHVESRALSRA